MVIGVGADRPLQAMATAQRQLNKKMSLQDDLASLPSIPLPAGTAPGLLFVHSLVFVHGDQQVSLLWIKRGFALS